MAGQDQSVNLGGMLTNIAETTGSMADAYTPVLKAATKPRGDMNDPAHLQRLAQWASNNGDSTAAASYMAEARRLADKATADAKLLRKEQGNAALGNIQLGMEQVLAAGGPDAEKRMEALQQAAVSTAERYGMDAVAAAGMSNGVREGQMRRQAQAQNVEIQARAIEDQKLVDDIEAKQASMDPEAFDRWLDQQAETNGSVVKTWRAADLQFKNAVAEAQERAQANGPLTEAEKEKAKEFGIEIEGRTARAVRNQVMTVETSLATQRATKVKKNMVSISTIKAMIPTVLAELEDYSGNPFWDSDVDDWAEDAIEDPALMEAVAAFAEAGGTIEKGPDAARNLKKAILEFARRSDSDIGEEIDKKEGKQTFTTADGSTVTIKEKEES